MGFVRAWNKFPQFHQYRQYYIEKPGNLNRELNETTFSENYKRSLTAFKNKPYYISFSNGGILQPVKSEETSKAANTDNNNLELSSNHSNKSSNETTTKTTTTSLNSKSTPVLDIDLSYFEDQSKTTNPSTANKPIQKNPRAYINELLDDIYVNNQKAVTNTNKKCKRYSLIL